ncbi:right-handed parallel beta-helix repeat-containing protein [Kitasatospora brasiliensis]|uniref:right-handed parallel beta-helix repeat-containing protein n=1 Tax=Kitasatospora brasiliensis TaxID=3058040 RepID=UPI002931B54F|nr:right-handed parallel beta-helix repeat-containing protein [Kitasatospora sp. K002]
MTTRHSRSATARTPRAGARRRRPAPAAAALALALALAPALAGCSSGGSSSSDAKHPGGTVVRVPQNFPTIQQAVDVAHEGDTVLVDPGTYRESVRLTKPKIVLRGTDRNTVVLDGGLRLVNGITASGPGSVVENLTVHGYLANGVLFTGVTDEKLQQHGAGGSAYDPLDTTRFPAVQGFRASGVTAYNNGLYGIYAFDARGGIIEDSYASGGADSGIYVGQCKPCDTLVRNNRVERNAVGIEITNASDNLTVVGNRATGNRVGITLNSNDLEALAPQHGAVIVGNVVTDNNATDTPQQADGGYGIGIGIGGGTANQVQRNLVQGNRAAGIVITDPPGHPASGNRIEGNRATGNGTDLVLASVDPANCFTGNQPGVQSPEGLETLAACGTEGRGAPPFGRTSTVQSPPGIPFSQVPVPPAQPSPPSVSDPNAPGRPAVDLPGPVDLNAYPLPESADALPKH